MLSTTHTICMYMYTATYKSLLHFLASHYSYKQSVIKEIWEATTYLPFLPFLSIRTPHFYTEESRNVRKASPSSRSLPGHLQTRRRPCPSRSDLSAFELSFSPLSSPPSLLHFPAAGNRSWVVKEKVYQNNQSNRTSTSCLHTKTSPSG